MRADSVKETETRRQPVAVSFKMKTSPRGKVTLVVILHFPSYPIAFLEMQEGLVHSSNMRTWEFSKASTHQLASFLSDSPFLAR